MHFAYCCRVEYGVRCMLRLQSFSLSDLSIPSASLGFDLTATNTNALIRSEEKPCG
ncbi:unnamed protein product [Rhodiola kirilowii]